MPIFRKKNKQKQRRFDINQTLVHTTYQPNRPEGQSRQLPTDPRAVSIPDAPKEKKSWRWTKKKIALIVFLVLLSPFLFIAGWDARNVSRASEKMFGSGNLISLLNAQQVKKSNDERTNVLLIGYSADDPGHDGATLTDSIMVLSLDNDEPKGYMLSVPRDLYVSIPEYGQAKVNEAFQAGGSERLEETIQNNFGIPIHYYVLVDYKAVRDTVNALGGITVDIKSGDPRGIFDPNFKKEEGGPLKLKNGLSELDGQTALRLTRARGATFGSYGFPRSDFNRTENQRKVLNAIKEKINWKFVLDPRVNSKFFDAVAENVETDIKIGEVLTLYRLYNRVPNGDMRSVSLHDLDKVNYYTGYTTPTGQSALIPAAGIDNFSQIKEAIKKLNQEN